MSKLEEFESLRKQGLTYKQIAERFGCSYQYVAQKLAGSTCTKFRTVSSNRCVYDGLRHWMNQNHCGIADLMKRIHGNPASGTVADSLRRKLRGDTEFRMQEIDAIIRITGLTYEELFDKGGAA